MLFERFFQRIDDSAVGAFVEKRRRLLEQNDDGPRIYVENVRSFFGMSERVARALCEFAVRQGLFERCVGVRCPNDDRILIDQCDPSVALPQTVDCEACEASEEDSHVFTVSDCKTITFYRLHGIDAGAVDAA